MRWLLLLMFIPVSAVAANGLPALKHHLHDLDARVTVLEAVEPAPPVEPAGQSEIWYVQNNHTEAFTTAYNLSRNAVILRVSRNQCCADAYHVEVDLVNPTRTVRLAPIDSLFFVDAQALLLEWTEYLSNGGDEPGIVPSGM